MSTPSSPSNTGNTGAQVPQSSPKAPSDQSKAPGQGSTAALKGLTKTPPNPSQNPKTPEASGEGASKDQQPPKEVAEAIQRRLEKVKVGGVEREVDVEELKRRYALEEGANEKFRQAAEIQRQAEEFIAMLKKDPRKVLSHPALGIDLRDFAESVLASHLEQEHLSPEQKRMRDLENQLRERDEADKQRQEQAKLEEYNKLKAEKRAELDSKFTEALNSEGLPRTPYTVRRMAEFWSLNRKHRMGLEPKDIVGLVREDYMQDTQALYGQLDGDTLLAVLGDGIANKIRKADLKRLRGGTAPAQVPPAKVTDAPKVNAKAGAQKTEVLNADEWRDRVQKKLRGEG